MEVSMIYGEFYKLSGVVIFRFSRSIIDSLFVCKLQLFKKNEMFYIVVSPQVKNHMFGWEVFKFSESELFEKK